MHGYEGFKEKVYRKTGIDLSLYKERQMKRRIDSLIKRNGQSDYDDYFTTMSHDKKVFDEFVNYLTINVSEFYRNPNQWDLLKSEILPMLMEGKKSIKVWSAACSTGEEPYTLVMVLSNFMPLKDIKVVAADIDLDAISKAKAGVYTEKAVAGVPKAFLDKYFTKVGPVYRINDEIKKCVEFKQMNLLSDRYPDNHDLIVCRNVMIYFTEEAKEEMYHKFNGALTKNGVLFVGSTEQIIVPKKFNFHAIKTFFYQRTE
jgi:chemotaxis protein methyltransferase CheR